MKKINFIVVLLGLNLISCTNDRPHYDAVSPAFQDSTGSKTDLRTTKVKAEFADFLTGDLVFQESNSDQSQAIQQAMGSKYSHCGIVMKNKSGNFEVLEAGINVTMTPLDVWINRGVKGEFVVKRYINSEELLKDNAKKKKAKSLIDNYLGRAYDKYFKWSDDSLYCSELIYLVFKNGLDVELCKTHPLETLDLTSPLVQKTLKERYGDNIPLKEPVVSPVDIMNSKLLKTVYEN